MMGGAAGSRPCCPPGSEKYLAADYATTGAVVQDGAGYDIYTSGTPGAKGLLIAPDIWGWNGGRTRAIADHFAEAGYFVVVLKCLQPPFEGGTDGDGLPPAWTFEERGDTFGGFMTPITWDGVVKPRVTSAVAFLKEKGVTSLTMIGICFGALVMGYTFDEFGDDFVCGVAYHPAVHLLDAVYGGDAASTTAFCSKVKKPVLFMPAGNDPDRYRPDGDIYEPWKAAAPGTECMPTEFKDVVHGFVTRGDLSNEVTKACVELAITKTHEYFDKMTSVTA
jgi:dienelactone hydrolase